MNVPLAAQTEFGSASFSRGSPTDITIRLSYRVPERRIGLQGSDLPLAAAALCEAEIEFTRTALADLGEALAGQLHDVGTRPTIRRQWEDQDERTFRCQDNVVTVDASRYASEEALSHPEGTSEAALVRELVAQVIDQRAQGIRSIYRKISNHPSTSHTGL